MIKAIETQYKGYRFRSRLEARWAVFFDALGVKWEYEPEGYDLGELGWYLPDFWLPEAQFHAEVKPIGFEEIAPMDLAKMRFFDDYPPASSLGLIFLVGPPAWPDIADAMQRNDMGFTEWYSSTFHVTGRLGISLRTANWMRVTKAVAAARSARFERGENGMRRHR